MDLATGWQIFTTVVVGLMIIITMKNDVATLKEMVKELREENAEIKKKQTAQDIELALMKGSANVQQYTHQI